MVLPQHKSELTGSSEPSAEKPFVIPLTMKGRVEQAVFLKINGTSWQALADRYGYKSADSARKALTTNALWRDTYNAERVKHLDDMEVESIVTLREFLRLEHREKEGDDIVMKPTDPKLRESAAHSLLHHSRALRTQKIHLTSGAEPFILKIVQAEAPDNDETSEGGGNERDECRESQPS